MADSILITGASSGIGKALAFEMAQRGYSLGLAARREDELETIQKQIREKHPSTKIAVRHLDVTAYETIPEVLAYFTSALGSIPKKHPRHGSVSRVY